MKKLLLFVVIAFSLYTITQSISCTLAPADKNKKNCLALNVNPTKQDITRCCWGTGKLKGEEVSGCDPTDYQNIKAQIALYEALGMTDVKVDCSSNYLKVAALLVLALLF